MSALPTTPPSAGPAPAPARRPAKRPGGAGLGDERSSQAKRLAAAILEVLAGLRTPAQAAAALGMSLPRYYHCEGQALRGLLAACEARPRGRRRPLDRELAALRQQQQRLERELARQQSLVRLAQRAVGLAPPAAAAKAPGKKRSRRPTARALHIAERLQQDSAAAGPATTAAPAT
jgi:hypothetical protein